MGIEPTQNADQISQATSMSRIMRVEDFDNYDQALLWAALQDGRLYATIVEGPRGPKVAYVSVRDPSDLLDSTGAPSAKVTRVGEIEGLADSASQPSAKASACGLQRRTPAPGASAQEPSSR